MERKILIYSFEPPPPPQRCFTDSILYHGFLQARAITGKLIIFTTVWRREREIFANI